MINIIFHGHPYVSKYLLRITVRFVFSHSYLYFYHQQDQNMYKFCKFVPAFLFLLLLPFLASAQQEDKIYFHNGKTIVGKVLGIEGETVNFVYLKMENVKCGKYALEKIVYAAGKTDIMTPKIIVTSKDDWEKVRLLLPGDDVSGLKYQEFVGDLRKPVTPDMVKTDPEAVKKMKQEAAAKGYPFIQVLAKKNIGYTYN